MKILAVDDDPIILELLSEVLRVVGFTNLTLCESAYEALELIEDAAVPFDCFLLDIQMPKMDGIELTSAIRKLPQHAKTPILMITAMSDRSYIDGAFAAGGQRLYHQTIRSWRGARTAASDRIPGSGAQAKGRSQSRRHTEQPVIDRNAQRSGKTPVAPGH